MTIFEAAERVSNIVHRRFGCKVEFHYAPNGEIIYVDKEVLTLFQVLKRNPGAKFVISQGSVLFPIYVDKDLFGCIEIKNGDMLPPESYEDLHILLDSTLRDFVIKKELLRRLKIQESILQSQAFENVIPIFKSKDAVEKKSLFSLVTHNDEPLRTSLFIQGYDYSKMRDLAVDIHSLMIRNSFVPYSVLDFKNSFMEEMAELGHITIFIPEILDLPAYEIEDITNYLSKNISPSCPFLIISSQKSLQSLETECLVPDRLIQILKRFHLEVNEDQEEQNKLNFWDHNPSPEIH